MLKVLIHIQFQVLLHTYTYIYIHTQHVCCPKCCLHVVFHKVAERKNRHLLEVTCILLFQINIPKYMWGAAVLTSAFLINHMPSWTLNSRTNISLLTWNKEPYSLLPRVFGCLCLVHNYGVDVRKLDPRSIKAIFLGYSPTQNEYK